MSQWFGLKPNQLTKIIHFKVILQVNHMDIDHMLTSNRYSFSKLLQTLAVFSDQDPQKLAIIMLWIKNNLLWKFVVPDTETIQLLRSLGLYISDDASQNSISPQSNQQGARGKGRGRLRKQDSHSIRTWSAATA